MNKYFIKLAFLLALGIISACDKCSIDNLDVNLLQKPTNALVLIDGQSTASPVEFFAHSTKESVTKNAKPLSFSLDLAQLTIKKAQEYSATLAADANLDTLITALTLAKTQEEGVLDLNGYINIIDDISKFDVSTYNEIKDIFNKNLYTKIIIAIRPILKAIADDAKTYQAQALLLPTYCLPNTDAHKNANSIKELVELLTNIELIDVDSVNVLSIVDSIALLTTSLTTVIKNTELADEISYNSAKTNLNKIIFDNINNINHLRKSIYPALLKLPGGKITIETPAYLTQVINFDVSKLESSELLALVQRSPSSLFFMLKNKSDLDVYAYYLAQSLYNNKKVYKADLFVIASAALGYGLNKDQFVDFMVSVIKEADSSVVILNNLSSLAYKYLNESSNSDENLIADNLESLLSKLSGVTILVPINSDSSLKNNSYFSSKFSDFSALTLSLSRAILNELIIDTEPAKTKEDIIATAKVLRALSAEKYSLGALYEIWQSYKKNPTLTQKELVLDVSNKLAGISDKDVSKKGLLELSWDFIEGLVQNDPHFFSSYKKPKDDVVQQKIFKLTLANIGTQVKDTANRAINDLNKKTAANVAQINIAKTTAIGDIDTSKNNALGEIGVAINDATTQATNAAASATAAGKSQVAAKASEDNAAKSFVDAQAEAGKAHTQAGNAANSAIAAGNSAVAANTSAKDAEKSFVAAQGEAGKAQAQAGNAANSALESKTARDESRDARDKSVMSAFDAKVDANSAKGQRLFAEIARDDAKSAELAAKISQNAAKTSEENAAKSFVDTRIEAVKSQVHSASAVNSASRAEFYKNKSEELAKKVQDSENKTNELFIKARNSELKAKELADKVQKSENRLKRLAAQVKTVQTDTTKLALDVKKDKEAVKVAKEEIELLKQEVEISKKEAEFAKTEAIDAQEKAEIAKLEAQAAKGDAETAQEEAEIAKLEAQAAKGDAETAQLNAEIAQEEAEQNKKDAANSATVANESKDKAETAKKATEQAFAVTLALAGQTQIHATNAANSAGQSKDSATEANESKDKAETAKKATDQAFVVTLALAGQTQIHATNAANSAGQSKDSATEANESKDKAETAKKATEQAFAVTLALAGQSKDSATVAKASEEAAGKSQEAAKTSEDNAEEFASQSKGSAKKAKEHQQNLIDLYAQYHKKLDEWDIYFNDKNSQSAAELDNKAQEKLKEMQELKEKFLVEVNQTTTKIAQETNALFTNLKNQTENDLTTFNDNLKEQIKQAKTQSVDDLKNEAAKLTTDLNDLVKTTDDKINVMQTTINDNINIMKTTIREYETHVSNFAEKTRKIQNLDRKFRELNSDDNNNKLREINNALANIEELRDVKEEMTKIKGNISLMNDGFFAEAGEVKTGMKKTSDKLEKVINTLKNIKLTESINTVFKNAFKDLTEKDVKKL